MSKKTGSSGSGFLPNVSTKRLLSSQRFRDNRVHVHLAIKVALIVDKPLETFCYATVLVLLAASAWATRVAGHLPLSHTDTPGRVKAPGGLVNFSAFSYKLRVFSNIPASQHRTPSERGEGSVIARDILLQVESESVRDRQRKSSSGESRVARLWKAVAESELTTKDAK